MPESGLESIQAQLGLLAEQIPELADAAAFYQRVLPVVNEASAALPSISLESEAAQRKLASGQPILVGETLEFDPEKARSVFLSLCKAVESLRHGNRKVSTSMADTAMKAAKIRKGIEAKKLDAPTLLVLAISGDENPIKEVAAAGRYDSSMLFNLSQYALKAFLRAWRREVEGIVDVENWKQSHCPFCGSPPGLAEIQGKQSERHLRCLRCGADWPYPNLQCAFCGCDDYHQLGILWPESDVLKYSVITCQVCKRYIKTIASYAPSPVEKLAIEDLATLPLDWAAVEKGYKA